jgi:hypothetical protein
MCRLAILFAKHSAVTHVSQHSYNFCIPLLRHSEILYITEYRCVCIYTWLDSWKLGRNMSPGDLISCWSLGLWRRCWGTAFRHDMAVQQMNKPSAMKRSTHCAHLTWSYTVTPTWPEGLHGMARCVAFCVRATSGGPGNSRRKRREVFVGVRPWKSQHKWGEVGLVCWEQPLAGRCVLIQP